MSLRIPAPVLIPFLAVLGLLFAAPASANWWDELEQAGDEAPAEEEGTCEASCGGQAPTGCWCDAGCVWFGDCCADKVAVCDTPEPAGSCAGACGAASDDGCWCDESCEIYGDCCGDKADVCDAYEVTLNGDTDGDGQSEPVSFVDLDGHAEDPISSDEDAWLKFWRSIFTLLALLNGGIADIGLNGLYDGVITDEAGHSYDAILDLVAKDGELSGSLWIVEPGLQVQTEAFDNSLFNLCEGTLEVPVSRFPIEGTFNPLSPLQGSGGGSRNVAINGSPLSGSYGFTASLDPVGLEILTVSLSLDLPSVFCRDSGMTGTFFRRPGSFN